MSNPGIRRKYAKMKKHALNDTTCPKCNQPPGHRCLGQNGKARKTLHDERYAVKHRRPGQYMGKTATSVKTRQMTPEEIKRAFG